MSALVCCLFSQTRRRQRPQPSNGVCAFDVLQADRIHEPEEQLTARPMLQLQRQGQEGLQVQEQQQEGCRIMGRVYGEIFMRKM